MKLQEAEENKIDLSDDDSAMIKLLIQYFYESDYGPKLPDDQMQGAAACRTAHAVAGTSLLKTAKGKAAVKVDSESGFPHPCNVSLNSWDYTCRELCSHHACGSDCSWNCVNFKCADCEPLAPPIIGPAAQLHTHTKIYEIADKYDV